MNNLDSQSKINLEVGTILYYSDEKSFHRFLHSLSSNVEHCRDNGIHVTLRVKWNSPPTFQLKQIEMLKNIQYSVELSHYNDGFGRAHNQMMSRAFDAGADYYLCINPDGFLDIDSVAKLVNFHENLPLKGIVEALQFPREHPKKYNPFTYETEWCSGACLLISRPLHEQIGGFDDRIFMYCEDIDLSWRTKEIGQKCYICPDALFFHDVRERKSKLIEKIMLESARYISIKWQNEDFKRSIEQILLDEQHYENSADMPTYDGLRKHKLDSKNQEWRYMLSFSQARW